MATNAEGQQMPALVRAQIEEAMLERYRQKALLSEIDFLVGAMTAMQALGYWPPPPLWVIFPGSGRSVVASILERQGEEQEAKKVAREHEHRMATIDAAEEMFKLVCALANEGGGWSIKPTQAKQWAEEIWQEHPIAMEFYNE